MAKKKTKHRKSKSKRRAHGSGQEATGHHARLRKHHAAEGNAGGRRRKGRKKSGERAAAERRSALMDRLHSAVAGAKDRLRGFGRRKPQPEKLVTEQTLRDHLALKRVRSCSR
jgi:hypothetical protein